MYARRDQYRSSFGAFTARERDLARSRARRDALDGVTGSADGLADAAGIAAPPPAADGTSHGAEGR
jgi:hypothetical protein